jgi:excisionase family DNA binding protein
MYRIRVVKGTMPPKRKHEVAYPVVTHPLGTEIYTTEEVAALLKRSVRTILRAIKSGKLEARKAGRDYLMTREAVRQYFENLPKATVESEVDGE